MKVLISWSGERSRQIAIALHTFLKQVIHATDPWMSDKDIGAGSFWPQELWEQLATAEAGIICLMPENLDAKWLHFEGGAIAKVTGKSCACPFLFDVKQSEIQGPLSFLQCKHADKKEDVESMIQAIYEKLKEKQLTAEQLKDSFVAFWPKLDKRLKQIRETEAPQTQKKQRPADEVMEDMLAGIRDLQNQVSNLQPAIPPHTSQFFAGLNVDHSVFLGMFDRMPLEEKLDLARRFVYKYGMSVLGANLPSKSMDLPPPAPPAPTPPAQPEKPDKQINSP
jgi:hypothetical protein